MLSSPDKDFVAAALLLLFIENTQTLKAEYTFRASYTYPPSLLVLNIAGLFLLPWSELGEVHV